MAQKMGLSSNRQLRNALRPHRQNTPLMAVIRQIQFTACKRTLNADQLKGLGYSLNVYLVRPRSVNKVYVQMNAVALIKKWRRWRLNVFPSSISPKNTDN